LLKSIIESRNISENSLKGYIKNLPMMIGGHGPVAPLDPPLVGSRGKAPLGV